MSTSPYTSFRVLIMNLGPRSEDCLLTIDSSGLSIVNEGYRDYSAFDLRDVLFYFIGILMRQLRRLVQRRISYSRVHSTERGPDYVLPWTDIASLDIGRESRRITG